MKKPSDSAVQKQSSYTTLSDKQLHKSIYVSVLMALLLPPFIGGSLMGIVGFYPLPEFYLIFLSYTGIYVFIVVTVVLARVPGWYRTIIKLTQLDQKQAQDKAQQICTRLPVYLFSLVTVYSILGALSADFSLEQMGYREYTLQDHLYNQFGIIPVVLITTFPIFFYFVDRLGRYLGPRGIYVTAVPLWVKILMLGIVTPLLIDSLLIGYYYNRTGYFQLETLMLWLSLLMLAVGGTWLAWRSLRQSIAPLKIFAASTFATIDKSDDHNLIPLSLDELGILTAQFDKLLGHQKELSDKLKHERDFATTLLNTAPMIVLLLDPLGHIKYVNPYFEQLSGYRLNEVKGKEWFASFLPARDQDRIRELFKHAIHDEPTRGNINPIITRKGEELDIEWYDQIMCDADGKMTGVLAVGQDVTERKCAEAISRDSQERVELLLNSTGESIYGVDLNGNCIFANPACIHTLGYDNVDELLGSNMHEVMHHTRIDGSHYPVDECQIYQAHVKGEYIHVDDEVFLRKDGTSFPVEYSSNPIRQEDKVIGSVVTFTDITERINVEEALREASELNESIVSESPIGILIYNSNGQCIVANESVAKMIGTKKDQVLTQNYNNLESWKKSGLLDAANKSIRMQEKERHEFNITSSFGKNAFYDCLLVPFMLQGEQHLLLMLDDITARKRVQEEYQILVESSHEVIFSKDREGYYHTANTKAAIGLGGVCIDDVVGKTDYDLMSKEKADSLREIDKQVMKNQQTIEVEEVVPISEGKNGIYLSRKWPTFDKEGNVSGIACFAMDITEIKAAEAELDKYRDQLEELVEERTHDLKNAQDELVRKERLATLGQLTATVSHELRNPLGAMKPSLYIIEKKSDKNDERVQQAIKRVDRNIDRCDHIIDELLDFTRLTELDRHVTRVDEWLESVIAEQEISNEIRVEKDFSLKEVELAIDADRLRRAVINVVDNACHSMMDEDRNIKDKNNACLCINTRCNDERIEIVISDNGSGITGDILERIFEPLFSTKGFGVGLGMSTVKQIMEQHGGGVDIKSEEGEGTTVVLWLPSGNNG